MSTDPIDAKLREVDAMCSACDGERNLEPGFADTAWCEQFHRLARELAKVSQERMRMRGQDYLMHKILDDGITEELDVDGNPIDKGIAALKLEGVKDA